MEKGLVYPNWLVTTRNTPSFPWKYFQSYNEITNAASTIYVMQVRQQEHDRAHVMLCDLRTQMNQEKHFELTKQKEMLKRGHEAEFQALMAEHDEALQR